jgi:hypothetical protein
VLLPTAVVLCLLPPPHLLMQIGCSGYNGLVWRQNERQNRHGEGNTKETETKSETAQSDDNTDRKQTTAKRVPAPQHHPLWMFARLY